MMVSLSKLAPRYPNRLTYAGKKSGGTHHKLILFTLQHNRSLAGGQRGPPLNLIGPPLESNLLPRPEPTESQVILLGIDFFHALFS
jgi:hypothetical protein